MQTWPCLCSGFCVVCLSLRSGRFILSAAVPLKESFLGARGDAADAGVGVFVGVTSNGWVSWPAGASTAVVAVGCVSGSRLVACTLLEGPRHDDSLLRVQV